MTLVLTEVSYLGVAMAADSAVTFANSFSHPSPWVKLKSTNPNHSSNVNEVQTLIKIHPLKFVYILDNIYALGLFAIYRCGVTQNLSYPFRLHETKTR